MQDERLEKDPTRRCRQRFEKLAQAQSACSQHRVWCGGITQDNGLACNGTLKTFELRSGQEDEALIVRNTKGSMRANSWVMISCPPDHAARNVAKHQTGTDRRVDRRGERKISSSPRVARQRCTAPTQHCPVDVPWCCNGLGGSSSPRRCFPDKILGRSCDIGVSPTPRPTPPNTPSPPATTTFSNFAPPPSDSRKETIFSSNYSTTLASSRALDSPRRRRERLAALRRCEHFLCIVSRSQQILYYNFTL